MDGPIKTLSGSFPWQVERPLSWPVTTEVGPGLSGVIACQSQVAWLDPDAGLLMYRGVPVERLAGSVSFEEVAHLLLCGRTATDDPAGTADFVQRLRGSRALPPDVVDLLRSLHSDRVHPTRLLRAGVSALGCHELSAEDDISGEQSWRELRIVGQVAALVAEIARIRRGLPPAAAPPDESGLAHGVLSALTGAAPDPADVACLDLLWVLYADHGLDAPSFTSMVVASCLADPYYNVVAGLSALHGPRLGGATEQVLAQLLPLTDPPDEEGARRWVRDTISGGGRIAGFGHRMYRMDDPRAGVLRRELALAARRKGRPELFAMARAVESEAARLLGARGVYVNINFYAAPLFHLLGAEAAMMPCLYAVGRMAGLVARVHEALDGGRLYRPITRYVGEAP